MSATSPAAESEDSQNPTLGHEDSGLCGECQTGSNSDRGWGIALPMLLGLAVIAIYGRTAGFDFVNYDDNTYVYQNESVTQGLSLEGVFSVFSRSQLQDWVPLTALSHMMDWELFGSWAGGHHLTSVFLHATSSVLLMVALRRMTGSLWRSAFVAALFALHPLRVESVAWVSERKDVLCGFFFMLALGTYCRYAHRPSAGRYAWVCLFLTCGLLSKAILVTTPLVFLLLDWWPLCRTARIPLKRLLWEKIPLFALCGTIGGVTAALNHPFIAPVPLSLRAANAVVSCAVYVGQLFLPLNLALHLPFPRSGVPIMEVVVAAGVLMILSALAWRLRRSHPYFTVGWLWYLVMLAPVCGLRLPGDIARADRYTYFPHIGLALILSWGGAEFLSKFLTTGAVRGFGIAAIVACAAGSCWQVGIWRDSETLLLRTLEHAPDYPLAVGNLCTYLVGQKRVDEAIRRYEAFLRTHSGNAVMHNEYGVALVEDARLEEALEQFQAAVRINPEQTEFHYNLGCVYLIKNQLEKAVRELQRAAEIDPEYPNVRQKLAEARFKQLHQTTSGPVPKPSPP